MIELGSDRCSCRDVSNNTGDGLDEAGVANEVVRSDVRNGLVMTSNELVARIIRLQKTYRV